jgi:integrase
LEDVTLHDLRRTHSTHAAAAGVDLRTLAARIGHTDLSMLEKRYAVVVGSVAVNAADTIQATFDDMIGPKKD